MWQIVANLEFVTGFAIDLQTRKPNISPRVLLSLVPWFIMFESDGIVCICSYYDSANRTQMFIVYRYLLL